MKLQIKPSSRKDKKFMAIFTDTFEKSKTKGGMGDKIPRVKITHFGASGYPDYTLTGDKEQRERYRARTKKVYDKAEPMSASRLSGDILWGDSTSLATNITNYKKKYGYK